MKTNHYLVLAVLSLTIPTAAVWAQAPHPDPVASSFYPPMLIMEHQRALDLTAEQRETIKAELQRSESEFKALEWDLHEAMDGFIEIIRQDVVDEDAAVAQLDKVLAVEAGIKVNRLRLDVRLKNILTADQRRLLDEIRG